MQPQTKKLTLITGLVLVLLIAFLSLINYVFYGKLDITTSDPSNAISIENQDGKVLARGSTEVKLRLSPGSYVVLVQGKQTAAKQLAQVSAREVTSYNIDPPTFSAPQPISGFLAKSLVVGNSSLRYLDTSLSKIASVGSSGDLTFDDSHGIVKAKWADTNYGIGQDGSGNIFVVDGSAVRPLQLPTHTAKVADFDITSSRDIYLVLDNKIYFGKENSLKQVYSTNSKSPQIIASRNEFALVESELVGAGHPDIKATVSIISNQGQIESRTAVGASDDLTNHLDVSWSDDGEKLLIENTSTGNQIYDASLQKIGSLPEPSIKDAVWLSSTKLLYAADNTVWVYSLDDGSSSVVGSLAGGAQIGNIKVTPDKTSIYAVSTSSRGGGIYKLQLGSKRQAGAIDKLSVFLPQSLNDCTVNYMVYKKPMIILLPYSPSSTDSCQQEAMTTLQEDSLDTSSYQFVVGPIQPGSD